MKRSSTLTSSQHGRVLHKFSPVSLQAVSLQVEVALIWNDVDFFVRCTPRNSFEKRR